MNQFKRARIVMLPTNDSNLYINDGNKLETTLTSNINLSLNPISQHLYFISDDVIKENDWIYCPDGYDSFTVRRVMVGDTANYKRLANGFTECNINFAKQFGKKIIATTDTSLFIITDEIPNSISKSAFNIKVNTFGHFGGDLKDYNKVTTNLPQPSQQFIQKYIEEYNKGTIITDVLVEYEQDYTNRSCSTCNLGTEGSCELKLEKKCCSNTGNDIKHKDYWISCLDDEEDSEIYKLKVNLKDNTITIKKLKDSWNREEHVADIRRLCALLYFSPNREVDFTTKEELDDWIDQNL